MEDSLSFPFSNKSSEDLLGIKLSNGYDETDREGNNLRLLLDEKKF